MEITDDKFDDSSISTNIIDKLPRRVRKVFAYRVYQRSSFRKYLFNKGLERCILPTRYEKIQDELEPKFRNDAMQIIRNLGNHEKVFSFLKRL